uniref:Transthyretin n=1 Tax=Aquila chrysaetos chrysaetos TaxID=223781 RepID=A0A663E712_AQUCH
MAFHSVFLVFLAGLAFFSEAASLDSADSKHPLLIKILDSVRGSPAPNVPVKLYKEAADGSWELLNSKQTNDNGELHELTTKEQFVTGIYKIELDTASYWKRLGLNPFHHHADMPEGEQQVEYSVNLGKGLFCLLDPVFVWLQTKFII